MNHIRSEQKKQRQKEVSLKLLEGGHPVWKRDDTQIIVYINEETEELNVWPRQSIEPYTIDKVFPLPSDAYFAAWVLLCPDWSEFDPDE